MDEGFRSWIATFDERGRDTWYAAKYSVSPGRVHVDSQPTDCDFWRAPIGLKGCHYDELVVAQPADEWVGNVGYLQVYVSWVKKTD